MVYHRTLNIALCPIQSTLFFIHSVCKTLYTSQTRVNWAASASLLESLNVTQISVGKNQTQGPITSLAPPHGGNDPGENRISIPLPNFFFFFGNKREMKQLRLQPSQSSP